MSGLGFFGSLVSIMMGGLQFFYQLTGNYAVAILLLTLVVRLLLLPFTVRSIKATYQIQALAPEVKRLQSQYKGDPKKANEAIMALYKQSRVTPLSGCFPVLLQFPILWLMVAGLEGYHYKAGSGFLWIPRLNAADPYYILPLIAAVTTFWSTKVSLPPATDPAQQMSQRITVYMMPVIIFFVGLKYPAALALYWAASNLFSVAQGYLIVRRLRPPANASKGEASR